jgi:hypothetical protein
MQIRLRVPCTDVVHLLKYTIVIHEYFSLIYCNFKVLYEVISLIVYFTVGRLAF